MGFVDVKLADVELEKPQPIPAGTYVFSVVPGAQYRVNQYNKLEELNVSFAVTEGDLAGRRVFATYPDPAAVNPKNGKPMAWSAQALKKLEMALGIDSLPGEDPATYLNRAAIGGNARVTATISERTYQDKNGVTKTQADFNLFSVTAAA